MPKVRFPLAVNLESINGTIERSKIVNGYAELASAQEVKGYSRPALTLAQGSFAVFGQGMALTPDDSLYVISGGNIYLPVPGKTPSVIRTGTTGDASFVLAWPPNPDGSGQMAIKLSTVANEALTRLTNYDPLLGVSSYLGNVLQDLDALALGIRVEEAS